MILTVKLDLQLTRRAGLHRSRQPESHGGVVSQGHTQAGILNVVDGAFSGLQGRQHGEKNYLILIDKRTL